MKSFKVSVDQKKLDDLKARLEMTRWPDEIENSQWQFGVSIAQIDSSLYCYFFHTFISECYTGRIRPGALSAEQAGNKN